MYPATPSTHAHTVVKYLGFSVTHLPLSEQTPGLRGDVIIGLPNCVPRQTCQLFWTGPPANTAHPIPDAFGSQEYWVLPAGTYNLKPLLESPFLLPHSPTCLKMALVLGSKGHLRPLCHPLNAGISILSLASSTPRFER